MHLRAWGGLGPAWSRDEERDMKTLFIALEGFTGPAFRRARELGALPALDPWCASGEVADLHFPLADMRAAMLVSTMTGSWPDQHGILTAETGDPATKTLRPATPADRFRPALWELLDDEGVPSLSVGWPLSINGRTSHAAIVSSEFGLVTAGSKSSPTSALHPTSLSEKLNECILHPEELDPAAIGSLMPRWSSVDPSLDARPGIIGRILAENVSRHAAFLELISSEEARNYGFATLCLSIVGEFASLERASESMGDGLLEGLSDRGLPFLNAFLEAILNAIPPDTNLIIAGIPHVETPEAGGFLLISGCAFVAGSLPKSVGITEIAPLALSSCGFLPVNLPNTRLVSLIRKDFSLQASQTESVRHPARTFITYWRSSRSSTFSQGKSLSPGNCGTSRHSRFSPDPWWLVVSRLRPSPCSKLRRSSSRGTKKLNSFFASVARDSVCSRRLSTPPTLPSIPSMGTTRLLCSKRLNWRR